MPWKLVEKMKGFLAVPYDFFRIFVYFCTLGFVCLIWQDGFSTVRLTAPVMIVLYVLLFIFKAAGKKISKEASDETDMAGVANWLAEAIYLHYKKCYVVKMIYFRDTEFQENHITGFRLEVKREMPKLQKW